MKSDELIQIRLNGDAERKRWRSLAEWLGKEPDEAEFAPGADEAPLSRRNFLQLVGASLALAGCTRDLPEKILPYTVRPPEVTPGVPSFYATSMVLDGYATGLVVESHEGRPTKIEGNPEHPSSLGGTSLWHQASVLQLYDPERARRVRHGQSESSWQQLLMQLHHKNGSLRLVLEPTSSPLVHELLARLKAARPDCKITFWSPCDARAPADGARLAFGRPLQPRHQLKGADVIVGFDADLLNQFPDSLRLSREWSSRRHPDDSLNRMYLVEPAPTATGSAADHRLRRRLGEIPRVVAAVAAELPELDGQVRAVLGPLAGGATAEEKKWAKAVARDLLKHRGAGVVVAGARLSPAVHALTFAMNAALGNLGQTLSFSEELIPDGDQDLEGLVGELHAGKVDQLIIAGANPVYAAAADLEFTRALARARESVYLGLYEDETAQSCTWSAPALHYLESWGDARAVDGTLSLVQPLVRPLHDGRQLETLLACLAGGKITDPFLLLRDSLEARRVSLPEALPRGFVPGAAPAVTPRLDWSTVAADLAQLTSAADTRLEVEFALSPSAHDGRFANNPWLQETPQPITKLTWDNAALISVATARQLGLANEDLVEIQVGNRRARSPILIVPGHADDCLTLQLGYGRSGAESLAATAGFNVYPLRTCGGLHLAGGAQVHKVGRYRLANTQEHWSMMGRDLALTTTAAEYRRDPKALTEHLKEPLPSLLPEVEYQGQQWAMSIDLSLCTGCSACTMACYTENNNHIVGKAEVLRHRTMDWLRIDTYFEGDPRDPGMVHQPMMCQHCENAPCEYVCPVNATEHSPDGLNEMVYNRCVGTRFCSNNCPYKVRRFNWYDWSDRIKFNQGLVQLHQNPDVTVRERGVMEKCSYCVQRIREEEIHASLDKREMGPVQTACQQACPTRAIQFGSLSQKDSEMVKWRKEERSYAVLHDQGTAPRTMYLARVNNPNPELE